MAKTTSGSFTVSVLEGGVVFFVDTTNASVTIPASSTTATWSATLHAYRREGSNTPTEYSCYITVWRKSGSTYTRVSTPSSKMVTRTVSSVSAPRTADSLVVTIADTNITTHANYLAEIEIPIYKEGQMGRIGRNYYYAGEWNNIAAGQSFLVSDAQAPYFMYQPSGGTRGYYLFAPDDNGTYTKTQMGTPSPNTDSRWKSMWDGFEYLITKAIFGEFAKFGSAIINGDWMISTYGTIYIGGDAASYEVNATSSKTIGGVTYTKDNAYTLFDPAHPHERKSGTDPLQYNFVPNYAVDLLTGKTYQHNAYVYGEIHCKTLFKNPLIWNTMTNYGTSSSPASIGGDSDIVFFAPQPYQSTHRRNFLHFPCPWDWKGKEIQFYNGMPKRYTYTSGGATLHPTCEISLPTTQFWIDASNNIVPYDSARYDRGEIAECFPRFKFMEDGVMNFENRTFYVDMSDTTTGAVENSNPPTFNNARSFKMLAASSPTNPDIVGVKAWYWYIYDVSYYLD